MRAELAAAKAEITVLKAKLSQNSQNSSKPPSSDSPCDKGKRTSTSKGRKKSKKRKRGGQPGHTAHFAPPPEKIDHIHEYRPIECSHCKSDLSDGELTGGVVNHYVYDLPEIKPVVHDHQCLDVKCLHCGTVSRGTLPSNVPNGQSSPRVQALVTALRGDGKLSLRNIKDVMAAIFHIPMSIGLISKIQHQVTQILEQPYREAEVFVQRQSLLHADETGWRIDKVKAWLWVAVSGTVAFFMTHKSRSKEAAKKLIGNFNGTLISDRFKAYYWYPSKKHQLCWAHLKRDFQSFLTFGKDEVLLGRRLLTDFRKMFTLWKKVRDGTLTRSLFKKKMISIRRRILYALEEGKHLPSAFINGKCKDILSRKEALFTFVDIEGIEPTNNRAEQAVRFGVLWRKGSFGSDSELGATFIERILTVRATLRNQGRSLFDFLNEACTAHLNGNPLPSLILQDESPTVFKAA